MSRCREPSGTATQRRLLGASGFPNSIAARLGSAGLPKPRAERHCDTAHDEMSCVAVPLGSRHLLRGPPRTVRPFAVVAHQLRFHRVLANILADPLVLLVGP